MQSLRWICVLSLLVVLSAGLAFSKQSMLYCLVL